MYEMFWAVNMNLKIDDLEIRFWKLQLHYVKVLEGAGLGNFNETQ